MDQRILVLSGTTTEINEKLSDLRYKNQMFDTRKYTDLVTLWIKGFPTLHFEIQIKRQQLDILQVALLTKCIRNIPSVLIGEHQFESLSDPIILFAAVSFI